MKPQHVTTLPPDVQAQRQAFYDRLAPLSMAPLWEVMQGIQPLQPRATAQPHLWPWDTIREQALDAAALLTAEEAERRVLVLENPAYPAGSRATQTLYAGIQIVMPGEIAPAHRHSQAALRFVLESDGGGYTTVGGERTAMNPGDFVITPAWSFHDHGNLGNQPVVWLDVLDIPIVSFFDASFVEHHNSAAQAVTRPDGDALARYGSGLLPIGGQSPYGLTSPIFSYPYARTRAALHALAEASPPDSHTGYALKYANPLTGGWAMPTIASWAVFIPKDFTTAPIRSTDGLIIAVAEGAGTMEFGDRRLSFDQHDIITAPNWTTRSIHAEEDTILFVSSDRGLQELVGLYREERLP